MRLKTNSPFLFANGRGEIRDARTVVRNPEAFEPVEVATAKEILAAVDRLEERKGEREASRNS